MNEYMQKEMNTRFKSIQKEMDTRFHAVDERFHAINDKLDKLYTLLYFILGSVFGLIGLIMWDRHSYIKPVKEDISSIIAVLKGQRQRHIPA